MRFLLSMISLRPFGRLGRRASKHPFLSQLGPGMDQGNALSIQTIQFAYPGIDVVITVGETVDGDFEARESGTITRIRKLGVRHWSLLNYRDIAKAVLD